MVVVVEYLLTHRYTTYDDTLGLVQKRSVTLNAKPSSHDKQEHVYFSVEVLELMDQLPRMIIAPPPSFPTRTST